MTKYGAYTGDLFAGMLADIGCEWALVGHSERRQYQKESNELIANKAKVAHGWGEQGLPRCHRLNPRLIS